jgi:precorrin-2 dehydrogenase/sirohydrochlorin ferrochelatase
VAERKVARLVECGAVVEVVAPTLTPGLESLKKEGRLVHHETGYAEPLIHGAFLVIGATDSDAVNAEISRDARTLGILVNIVDDPGRCDFILPSIVKRGELVIAVSTGGFSPALAKKMRAELDARYGPEYAALVDILGRLRRKVIEQGRSSQENRDLFTAVISSGILDPIRAGRWDEVKALIRELTGVELEVSPS